MPGASAAGAAVGFGAAAVVVEVGCVDSAGVGCAVIVVVDVEVDDDEVVVAPPACNDVLWPESPCVRAATVPATSSTAIAVAIAARAGRSPLASCTTTSMPPVHCGSARVKRGQIRKEGDGYDRWCGSVNATPAGKPPLVSSLTPPLRKPSS